jgi:hypothetical protein
MYSHNKRYKKYRDYKDFVDKNLDLFLERFYQFKQIKIDITDKEEYFYVTNLKHEIRLKEIFNYRVNLMCAGKLLMTADNIEEPIKKLESLKCYCKTHLTFTNQGKIHKLYQVLKTKDKIKILNCIKDVVIELEEDIQFEKKRCKIAFENILRQRRIKNKNVEVSYVYFKEQ